MTQWFRYNKDKISAKNIVSNRDVKILAKGKNFGDIVVSHIRSRGDVIVISGNYIDQRVHDSKQDKHISGDKIFLGYSLKMKNFRQAVRKVLSENPEWQISTSLYPERHIIDDLETDFVNIRLHNIFIGLYGKDYSLSFYKPSQILSVDASTIPELELRYAQQSFKRCLCFISRANVSKPLLLEAPELETPNILILWWLRLKNWFHRRIYEKDTREIVELARAQYTYTRTREIVERLNKHYEKSYHAMFQLRELAGEQSGTCFHFNSPTNLTAQLTKTLRQYHDLEITGFVPSLIKTRWIEWAQEKKEKIEIQLSLLGLEQRSVVELQASGDDKSLQVTGLWGDFINYVWHKDVEAMHTSVYGLTRFLADAQILRAERQQLFSMSIDFNGNYEKILINLRKWVRGLPSIRDVNKQIREMRKNANEIMREWYKLNKELKNKINKAESGRIQELFQEILKLTASLESIPYLENVIYLTSPHSKVHSLEGGGVDLFHAKRLYDQSSKQHKKVKARLDELDQIFINWRSAVKTLKEEATNPQFGRCLFSIGRDGSGKSHFVARLLNEMTEYDIFPLLLDKPQVVNDWKQFLTETACLQLDAKDTGPEWRGLYELDRYLSGKTRESIPFTPLVIILDDLESWIKKDKDNDFLEKLSGFIKNHTQLSTMRWVITLAESAYFDAVPEESFFVRYGFQPENQPVKVGLPGWIILDDLNEKMRIGEQIIGKEKINKELFEPNPAIRSLIHNPFIAWTVAELDLLPELPNLNFIELIQRLWIHRLKELTKIGYSRHPRSDLRHGFIRFVKYIAERFVKEGKTEFERENLPSNLAKWDASVGDVNSAPSILSKPKIAGIVTEAFVKKQFLVPTSYDPNLVAERGDVLQLAILPFWLYWGGLSLAEELANHVDDSEKAWQTLNSRFDFAQEHLQTLAASLLEFTILCLDDMTLDEKSPAEEGSLSALVQKLTEHIIDEIGSIRSNIWLAAAKAGFAYQRNLGQGLVKRKLPLKFIRREELYHFMYFLRNAKLDKEIGLAPHVRLKLLCPSYPMIEETGFISYFDRLVNYLLDDWIGGAEIARTAACLYGVEIFWDAEQRGKWIYKKLYSLALIEYENGENEKKGGDNFWKKLLDWLLILRNEVSKIRYQIFRYDTKPERDRLWSWVIGEFCSTIVNEKGLSCFEWLASKEWFSWSKQAYVVESRINAAMEEQLTTALGRWYRKANKKEENLYIGKVKELAEGNGQQKVTAIFLIYHTVPKNSDDKLNRVELLDLLIKLYKERKAETYVEKIWKKVHDLESFYKRQTA